MRRETRRVGPSRAGRLSRCVAVALCAALAGCGDDGPATPSGCARPTDAGGEQSAVMTSLLFERGDTTARVSRGFDLDGVVSTGQDVASCFRQDYTDPDGRRGVDNQAATLFRIIDGATNNALDPLLQGAINNGQVLLGLTFEGLDDWRDDACVSVTFRRLTGSPRVGSDMRIVRGMTFDAIPGEIAGHAVGAVRDGVFEAGPFELVLPIAVLDARFIINLHGTRVRLSLSEEGNVEGLVGGGIVADESARIASGLGLPESARALAGDTVRRNTDLAPDAEGACTQISGAFTFLARPAFINH
ncbi:MAG: hypothetical protein R3A52_03610 [Polyangiales bacterium]